MREELLGRSCWEEGVGEKVLGQKLLGKSCWAGAVGEKLLVRSNGEEAVVKEQCWESSGERAVVSDRPINHV